MTGSCQKKKKREIFSLPWRVITLHRCVDTHNTGTKSLNGSAFLVGPINIFLYTRPSSDDDDDGGPGVSFFSLRFSLRWHTHTHTHTVFYPQGKTPPGCCRRRKRNTAATQSAFSSLVYSSSSHVFFVYIYIFLFSPLFVFPPRSIMCGPPVYNRVVASPLNFFGFGFVLFFIRHLSL